MSEKYWDAFVVTGRVADYLNYKNRGSSSSADDNGNNEGHQTGAKKRESDCSDGDGAVGGTHR